MNPLLVSRVVSSLTGTIWGVLDRKHLDTVRGLFWYSPWIFQGCRYCKKQMYCSFFLVAYSNSSNHPCGLSVSMYVTQYILRISQDVLGISQDIQLWNIFQSWNISTLEIFQFYEIWLTYWLIIITAVHLWPCHNCVCKTLISRISQQENPSISRLELK